MSHTKLNTADQTWVRKMNRSVILAVFRTQKTLSRAQLAIETGLNPSTVSSIIGELIQENLIRETDLDSIHYRPSGSIAGIKPRWRLCIGN